MVVCYNSITFAIQLCYSIIIEINYKCVTKMKAKKTSPKSVRFNKEKLDVALFKSNAASIQELIDLMLDEYVNGVKSSITKKTVEVYEEKKCNTNPSKIQSLKNIIANPPATKGYFRGVELPDFDPEIGIDGITNPNANF